MLYYIERFFIKIIRQVFFLFPVKANRCVFMNFAGRGYGDNPKYITEYLLKQKKDLEIIWLTNSRPEEFPADVTIIKYGTLRAYYMLGTAKIWVDNVRYLKGIKKKRSQIYIQTWHASFSQKKLEKEAEPLLGVAYVRAAKKDGKIANVMLSNSKLQSQDFKENFWFKGKILECGYPRNDILINNSKNSLFIENIKKKMNLPLDYKIVLFAPTFRDSDDMSNYILDFDKISKIVSKHYGKRTIVLVRLHPNVAKKSDELRYSPNVINASNYPDMQELLLLADLLITDYSTSIFDIMLINHEVIIYAKDIEEYNISRGLKSIFWELPFPLAESDDQLYHILNQPGQYNDREKVEQFKHMYGTFDDGNGSKMVGDYIITLIQNCYSI